MFIVCIVLILILLCVLLLVFSFTMVVAKRAIRPKSLKTPYYVENGSSRYVDLD